MSETVRAYSAEDLNREYPDVAAVGRFILAKENIAMEPLGVDESILRSGDGDDEEEDELDFWEDDAATWSPGEDGDDDVSSSRFLQHSFRTLFLGLEPSGVSRWTHF
jgi:hypothetical protein